MRTIRFTNQSFLKDSEVIAAVAAIQRQANEHFAPVWGMTARMLFVPSSYRGGGEVIRVMDTSDQAGALGYHTLDPSLTPVGFAFVKGVAVPWQTILSHETLEQLADPFCNTLMSATYLGKAAALACEVGDPVENDQYQIDGIWVSNFIFPAYFLDPAPNWSKLDHIGKLNKPLTMTPGGYQSYTTDLVNYTQSGARKIDPDDEPFHRIVRRIKK